MKKVLIVVLLLIPLIIMLTINVAGTIISDTMDITVEKIIAQHRGTQLIDTEQINVTEYLRTGKGFKIDTLTYPTIATTPLKWETDNALIATVDDTGYVTFTGRGFGEVTITVRSSKNVNVNATVTFFVFGEEVVAIDILPYGGTVSDEVQLTEGDSLLLTKNVLPASAIKNKPTQWSSDNTSVCTVDGSGIISAVSNGEAHITATVMEGSIAVTDTILVKVADGNSPVKRTAVYVTENTYDLTAIMTDSLATVALVEGDATLTGTTLTKGADATATVAVTLQGVTRNVTVHFTSGALVLGFEGIDVLNDTAWADGAKVKLNVLEYALTAKVLNEGYAGNPTINLASDNTNILVIENGYLKGIAGGTATITASAEGMQDLQLTVTVLKPLENISLALDNRRDNRGIEGTVVFGNMFMVNPFPGTVAEEDYEEAYRVVHTYRLEVATVSPVDGDRTFTYYSSNEEYATVDDEGLVTFNKAACGNEVTIFVAAKYTFGTTVQKSYTFRVVEGVNIGVGIADADNNDDNPMTELYSIFRYYADIARLPIVLHSDIYYYETDEWLEVGFKNSIYGNGRKIDAREYVDDRSDTLLSFGGSDNPNVEFRNLTVNGYWDPDGGNFQPLIDNGGLLLMVRCVAREDGYEPTLTVKYCTFQNTYNMIYVDDGNLVVDGCLLKNSVNAGISVTQKGDNWGWAPKVTIKNCIMTNIIAAAAMLFPEPNPGKTDLATITLEGESYIYNWKKIKDINLALIPEDLEFAGMKVSSFNPTINGIFQSVLMDESTDHLKVKAREVGALRNEDYVNFGIFVIGLWEDPNQYKVYYDSNLWSEVKLDLSNTAASFLPNGCNLYTSVVDGYFNTDPETTYDQESDEDGNPLYLKRLRGEV